MRFRVSTPVLRGPQSPPGKLTIWAATIASLLFLMSLWLVTRPYVGIIHDSRLYTLQALNSILENRFASDLFLRYGSQDQFSIFSKIYGPFINYLGLATANLILLIFGHTVWLSGLAFLAAALFDTRKAQIVAIAAAILLPGQLGPFRYGEPFLTPRIYAEALTLFALSGALRGAAIRASLCSALAIAFHPLVAIPGCAVSILYVVKRPKVLWLCAAVLFPLGVGLAFLGIEPFVRFMHIYDAEWFSIVSVRDSFCFVSQWGFAEWTTIGNTVGLGCYLAFLMPAKHRTHIRLVLFVGLAGIFLSVLGGDIARDVLIVDLQLWRAMWIPVLMVHLYAGVELLSWDRHNQNRYYFYGAVAVLATSNFFPAAALLSLPLCAVANLVHCRVWFRKVNRRPLLRIPVLVGRVVFAVCAGAVVFILVYAALQRVPASSNWAGAVIAVLASTGLALLLISADDPLNVFGSLSVAALLMAASIVFWDRRSPWTRFIDSAASPPPELTSLVAESTEVYWESDVAAAWFLLKRPNYFSCEQGSGALFSRGNAIEYRRRFEVFEKLKVLDLAPAEFCRSGSDTNRPHQIDRSSLFEVCSSERELGTLVLLADIPNVPHKVWYPPVPFSFEGQVNGKIGKFATDRFFIYSCSQIRN